MAAPIVLIVEIRWRWWLRWYLLGVYLTAKTFGLSPDWPRVQRWIRRGLVATVTRGHDAD